MTDESNIDPQKGFNLSADDPLGQLRQLAEDHSFIDELSPTFHSFEDGTLHATFPHQDQWANPGMKGSLHGGIVCAMLDTVMGFALMGTAATTEVSSGPTVNLNVNFLVGANEDFEAVGDVVRMGSSTAVVDGTLRGIESGETIATAQGVWRVYEK
jgi:uncharacterized protein (TIGR00369 family)